MDPASKSKQPTDGSGGGYGYNYGGNYAGYSAIGYGYGEGGGGGSVQRSLQDYLLILRERIWYIIVVFLVVFSSSLVFTLSSPKIYQSTATVQIFRQDPTVMQVQQVMDNTIRGAEDLNTQMKVLESSTIIQRVAERITGEDKAAFLAPYEKSSADTTFVAETLAKNRKVQLQRLTLIVTVSYEHQDRFVAAKVANLFVDEYLRHNTLLRIDDSAKAFEDLKTTVEGQRKKVDQLAKDLQALKEKNNEVSLDTRKDIVNDKLKALSMEESRAGIALGEAQVRLNQVTEFRAKGIPLTDLSFISSQLGISQLTQQLAAQNTLIEGLRKRYRDKHPNLVTALTTQAQIQQELAKAVDSARAQVESDYEAASHNAQRAREELAKQKADSIDLDRSSLPYTSLEREYKIQDQLLSTLTGRATETSLTGNISTQNARIVDQAVPPPENKPISPNVPLNLGLGVAGGLGLGLAFAFFVAFIDDRVKSSFDIEGVVGLPLIGIIPQIKRMDQPDKAQIVVNNADRQVAEAFLTLHSSLRLKDESKNAKCILITSTIPGEGKSFTTTNLALTFAAHGERVIVVDCDLRKPNIHKSFRVENLKGVIDVCAGTSTLDEATLRNVQPNFDLLPAGGRAKNPTQILNSKGFEVMISELRKRYDRVFIDTPPLAAVSDALIILPLVDGSIFTIFFNKVRRKAAQFSAKKMLESNVPTFGAVLNGLNLAVSGYYYAQYYDKSYKDYYVVMAKGDGPDAR
jgi:succinoglycan biosynthesis transport protein ExoP